MKNEAVESTTPGILESRMIKVIWKDPVWSKVIATGIVAIIASAGTYLFGMWPTIGGALKSIWLFITSSTQIPNWVLGIMSIPCLLFILVLLVELKNRFLGEAAVPGWKNYTKDEFFDLLWSWRYTGNQIDNLYSLCPRCKYQIIPKDISSYRAVPKYEYSCDDCGYSAGSIEGVPSELYEKVQLKIQKIIRTEQWLEKINA